MFIQEVKRVVVVVDLTFRFSFFLLLLFLLEHERSCFCGSNFFIVTLFSVYKFCDWLFATLNADIMSWYENVLFKRRRWILKGFTCFYLGCLSSTLLVMSTRWRCLLTDDRGDVSAGMRGKIFILLSDSPSNVDIYRHRLPSGLKCVSLISLTLTD